MPARTDEKPTVVAGALGECVHVAGVMNFLRLAEAAGWRTVFLGPSVAPEDFLDAARREQASLVGVSYRLTPDTGERLLGAFAEMADDLHEKGVRFVFGGTPPVAERARKLTFFEKAFDGSESTEQVLRFLKGLGPAVDGPGAYAQHTVERIKQSDPYPLLRHHFGLPMLQDTLEGITAIANAGALDVISLGVDQDAQANFFHPERQTPRSYGAGGVPVRTPEDYRRLFEASRTGNYPLLRTYSGTDDFIRLAEMYVETINIAWCAIPIFWFNQMDGRGPWDLTGSIREHQKVMAWYGERGIPVELNEPHHWGMRDAPDVVFVVSAFLSAYNARAFGVRDYIAQFMFNSPPGLSDAMDLAKMLACVRMIEPLQNESFKIWRQVRTGLLSFPLDPAAARAHLAISTYVQMALKPHIVHIVGHTEAHHAATAEDVIEASRTVRRAIDNSLRGGLDLLSDQRIQERAEELVGEAKVTLDAIRKQAICAGADAWTDPDALAAAVTSGILDAPHLKNNAFARGKIQTRIDHMGACEAVHPQTNQPISERERIAQLGLLEE